MISFHRTADGLNPLRLINEPSIALLCLCIDKGFIYGIHDELRGTSIDKSLSALKDSSLVIISRHEIVTIAMNKNTVDNINQPASLPCKYIAEIAQAYRSDTAVMLGLEDRPP